MNEFTPSLVLRQEKSMVPAAELLHWYCSLTGAW